MLSVTEVAERLNVSDSLVYALVEAGKIAVHRIGLGRGAIRIHESDLELYLASCRHEELKGPRRLRRFKSKHY